MKSFVAVYLFVILCNVDFAELRGLPECRGTYLSYPEDCTKFYLCLRGRLFKLPCSKGLHWNEKRKTCDKPAIANCVEIPKNSNGATPLESRNVPSTVTATEPATEAATIESIGTVTPGLEPNSSAIDTKKEEMKIICYCEC